MKLFKHIKSGKLYIMHVLSDVKDESLSNKDGIRYTALPYIHNGAILINVDMKDFVPVMDKKFR